MAIVFPPNRIFENAEKEQRLEEVVGGVYNPVFTELKKDEEGRLLSYSSDNILPRKGLIYPSAARHNNTMKAILVFIISLISFRPTVKWLDKCLRNFYWIADRVYMSEVPKGKEWCDKCGQHTDGRIVRSDFMYFQHYNACSQEVWVFIINFLVKLGAWYSTGNKTGKILGTVLEYEEIYRFRGQDIFTAINIEWLIENPRKELKRVSVLYFQREKFIDTGRDSDVGRKFKHIFTILSLALLIPKVKKAFIYAVKQAKWEKLRMDKVDIYWALLYPNYDYFGEPIEKRREIFTAYCNAKGVAVEFK